MKVLGTIKEIINKQSALDQLFLIAFEMNRIIDDFLDRFNKSENQNKPNGIAEVRMKPNVCMLKEIFDTQDVTFEESDSVNNIIMKRVKPDAAAKEFVDLDKEGEKRYPSFNTD